MAPPTQREASSHPDREASVRQPPSRPHPVRCGHTLGVGHSARRCTRPPPGTGIPALPPHATLAPCLWGPRPPRPPTAAVSWCPCPVAKAMLYPRKPMFVTRLPCPLHLWLRVGADDRVDWASHHLKPAPSPQGAGPALTSAPSAPPDQTPNTPNPRTQVAVAQPMLLTASALVICLQVAGSQYRIS